MKDKIKRIIIEWQEKKHDTIFSRRYNCEYSEEINTIIGLRRSGKTYFIFSQIIQLIKEGVHPSFILYINFDDERLSEIQSEHLDLITDAYFELYPENIDNVIYIFFDEIQNIQNWHLFIKRLYEQKRFKITITGSSSKLLAKEIATELRGRTLSLFFYPLCFREFLEFKKFEFNKNIEFSKNRFQLIKYVDEFLNYGGFPRICLVSSVNMKKELLKDYLDMIIYKDIVERYDVRNTHLLKIIIQYLLSNCASEFSINSFIKKFKNEYRLNKDTVFNYFSYLEDVGFIHYLPRFSYKMHQRYLVKKVYIADNGFTQLFVFRGMEISGRLLENLVFTELLKNYRQIFYFKDEKNYECDFIISENQKVKQAIQVTHTISFKNRDREIRGLITALKKFNLKKGIIITTADEQQSIIEDGYEINITPLWKYLLNISS
ncbi:ATPase AAA [Candidatus Magnetomorum sp. HK-1]|nr:ATPase AAA [Candidatus Magnetomorum sp. HK-1]